MSRRRNQGPRIASGQGRAPGQGKHRLARIQRFKAKHPDSKKVGKGKGA